MQFVIKPKQTGKLEHSHLTPGQRDGLKQHEITGKMFDSMKEWQQRMWVQEMHDDLNSGMRNFHKKDNSGLRELLTKKT